MSPAKYQIGEVVRVVVPDNPNTYRHLIPLAGQEATVLSIIGEADNPDVLEDCPLYYVTFPITNKKTFIPEDWLEDSSKHHSKKKSKH